MLILSFKKTTCFTKVHILKQDCRQGVTGLRNCKKKVAISLFLVRKQPVPKSWNANIISF